MKHSELKHGCPHTDGKSKLATMLLYLNDKWDENTPGCLRVLHGKKLEPYEREIPPRTGNLFAFLRGDHSWHGHEPFQGERHVVQIAWIVNEEALERKRRKNFFTQFLKGIFKR